MKPVLQALLLADRIYEDKATGKRVIAGTFNKLAFKKGGNKPKIVEVDGEERHVVQGGTHVGSPSAYISLTEVLGEIRCVLRFVSLQDDQPLFECSFKLRCEDPLQTIEIALPLPPLPHISGVHALELLCDDEPLGSHRVIVEEIPEDDPHDDNA